MTTSELEKLKIGDRISDRLGRTYTVVGWANHVIGEPAIAIRSTNGGPLHCVFFNNDEAQEYTRS